MNAFKSARRSIFLLFFLLMLSSCALTSNLTSNLVPNKQVGPKVFYTVPPVTYIRELPGYASKNVGPVYHGEQVTILSIMEDEDWCRVQASSGQQGWIQRALLSPVPLRVETYYVQEPEVPLRPEPKQEVISRQMLHQGDEVIKLAEKEQGWWQVLVERDKSLGWVPAASLGAERPMPMAARAAAKPSDKKEAEAPSSSPPGPPQFFVAVNSLELHLLPLVSSKVVKVLQFNDKVEEISRSGPAWRKVRFPETGVQGWTQESYLAKSPGTAPKAAVHRKKAPARTKRPGPKKKTPGQAEELDPEVM